MVVAAVVATVVATVVGATGADVAGAMVAAVEPMVVGAVTAVVAGVVAAVVCGNGAGVTRGLKTTAPGVVSATDVWGRADVVVDAGFGAVDGLVVGPAVTFVVADVDVGAAVGFGAAVDAGLVGNGEDSTSIGFTFMVVHFFFPPTVLHTILVGSLAFVAFAAETGEIERFTRATSIAESEIAERTMPDLPACLNIRVLSIPLPNISCI